MQARAFYLALGLVAASWAQAPSFNFTTLAGSAPAGSADGVGAQAHFSSPGGVAADGKGHVFVAETLNNTVRLGRMASAEPQWLQISRSGNEVVLSWPTSAAGFELETTGSVGAGAAWTR